MKPTNPNFLQPGRRVRWHTRTAVGDRNKIVLQDYAATVIKRGPPGWWFIQVDGESEIRRVGVAELAEDFLIPELLPECAPSPWTQNRLAFDDDAPIPEPPAREPEIDWNAIDIPF